MSTASNPLVYQYYQPNAQNAGFNTTPNAKQAAENAAEFSVNTGGQLLSQDQSLANQYGQEQAGVENYLQPLEQTNASGQGGYTPGEASQIELTPGQESNIVTNAGISAGAGNASAVGAAERAYAATGGNPAALATYRARAAQSQAANAGQASPGAEVAAQQAGSAGAQAVGNAQLAQENQGLGYEANLQSQLGNESQTEQGLGGSVYGTETGALTGTSNSETNASSIPTTSDKIIGGISGAAQGLGTAALGAAAIGLADGTAGYLDDGQDAIVGESGLEAVVEDAPKAVVRGASDPVRSNTRFMADGDNYIPGAPVNVPDAGLPGLAGATTPTAPLPSPQAGGTNAAMASTTTGFGQTSGMPAWLQSYLANQGKTVSQSPQPGQQSWNKTTPYSQLGKGIGTLAAPFVRNAIQNRVNGNQNGQQGGVFAPGSSQMPMSPDTSGIGGDIGGDVAGLGDAANSGVADIAGAFADGYMPRYLDDGAPESQDYAADPQNSSEVSRLIASESMAADGKMMAGGHMGSGFHWASRMPHAPHVPAGGYTPLNNRPKPMLADGAATMVPGMVGVSQSMLDANSRMQKERSDYYNALTKQPADNTERNQYYESMAGNAPEAPDYMADGSMAMPQAPSVDPAAIKDPMSAMGASENGRVQNGQQVGAAKVFTKPTLIHLEKADAVVPLSYRPKAKVRPSAAVPALMAKPRRPMYGGARI
jgi:hypothetical protein